MDLVIRGVFVYLFLLVIMRASGNRQFSELTAFDAVLIIIVAEATSNALIGDEDFSITGAAILIVTLVGMDVILSQLKQRSRKADLLLEGVPVLLMDNGTLVQENMDKERVDEEDILTAAREIHGIEDTKQIKYAVLERDGKISIVPA